VQERTRLITKYTVFEHFSCVFGPKCKCSLRIETFFIALSIHNLNSLSHQSGVLTAFPQRCKVVNRNMLKTNAAAWRLHIVLDSALWERCDNAVGSSTALLTRCGHTMCTLYRRLVNPVFGLGVCNAF